jgi:hypothetical protein
MRKLALEAARMAAARPDQRARWERLEQEHANEALIAEDIAADIQKRPRQWDTPDA